MFYLFKDIFEVIYQFVSRRMKNLGYLECQKEGYHTGQFLNIICLQSACTGNNICCCVCVQQSHQSHKTKTLKKILIDADTLYKNYKQPSKGNQAKLTSNCNTDIMVNMAENEEKQMRTKFYQLKAKFIQEIDKLQDSITTYYKTLHSQLSKQENKDQDIKTSLAQSIQLVQGSGNIQSLKQNVVKLLRAVDAAEKISGKQQLKFQKPDEESYLNYLKNSKNQISAVVDKKFKDLYAKLKKENQKLNKVIPRISSFWENQLFKFSNTMHHSSVTILNPFCIRANVDSIYQVAVMEPSLSFMNQFEAFRFRINNNDLQWVGLGVCYKNIIQKNDYQFKFDGLGHGCYMISGNAGTWSHSDADFNNCVKAFYFKKGDSITCAVYKDRICFIKEVPVQHEFSEQYSQREYFQMKIVAQQNDTLQPCVVSYYKNTEVEYLPSFSSQLKQADMPHYRYKFSNKWKHHNTIIFDEIHAFSCEPTQYKSCILDTPIQDNNHSNQIKSITFRIVRSTGSWIGVGLCHKNIVVSKNYDFNFEGPGHGCYMISANGGSWSHSDSEANNLVRAFKLVEGDLITVSLDQQNKKILFKRSIDKYQLSYNPINGDKLYPVIVLYFPDDEVEVLPQFSL